VHTIFRLAVFSKPAWHTFEAGFWFGVRAEVHNDVCCAQMYMPEVDTPFQCRTTNLNEDLGQVGGRARRPVRVCVAGGPVCDGQALQLAGII
jgi:hypothetical protein